jgi:cytochrome P450
MEIITSYCHGNPWKTLDYPNFDHPALLAVQSIGGVFFTIQHFPFIRPLVFGLPDSMKSPDMIALDRLAQKTVTQIDDILADPSSMNKATHETIYHHLLSTESGRQPPSRESLINEARVLVFAGSETVADACDIGIFHVLKDHRIRRRLVEEIKGEWPDKSVLIGLQILEKLPYLVGFLHGFLFL